ncbi:hypothetical protein EV191_102189 [Tamaricihabitans halophyticus]|uniref:Uncharacterized protein n=1 Tax=Tamaricihabitans halophyticus TaxID=1262583 RepID=A0A4R2R0L0_9PSEU|nr:hypothetical protein EV191_102189 [Tamaricihabitans halophyticus]
MARSIVRSARFVRQEHRHRDEYAEQEQAEHQPAEDADQPAHREAAQGLRAGVVAVLDGAQPAGHSGWFTGDAR